MISGATSRHYSSSGNSWHITRQALAEKLSMNSSSSVWVVWWRRPYENVVPSNLPNPKIKTGRLWAENASEGVLTEVKLISKDGLRNGNLVWVVNGSTTKML